MRQVTARGDGFTQTSAGNPMLGQRIQQLTVIQNLLLDQKLAETYRLKCAIRHQTNHPPGPYKQSLFSQFPTQVSRRKYAPVCAYTSCLTDARSGIKSQSSKP